MENLDIDKLRDFIIKALDLYDKNNLKYSDQINSKMELSKNDDGDFIAKFFHNKNQIFKAYCQTLGYYDILNKIWIWGWLLPINNNETQISRELLDYGLKLDILQTNAEQIFYKSLLLNSRYIVNDKIGLDINLAIFSSLLKEKILFIYPRKIDNIIIFYSIIK
jgi:hypothetical protein